MCFSVNVNLIKEELENRYGATLIDPDKYRPSYYYHAFVLPEMPVICSDNASEIRLMTWGLIPSGTRTAREAEEIRMKTFNARAEGLGKKASFLASFRSKRCIVPVKGFYEWQHRGKEKVPWYIYHADNEIFSLAGLFDQWTSTMTGEIFNTFTVITTDANDMLAEIHNSTKRMPAILERSSERSWLDLSLPPEKLPENLRPYPGEFLRAHTIGPLVNKKDADRNTPEVIRHWQYGGTLF